MGNTTHERKIYTWSPLIFVLTAVHSQAAGWLKRLLLLT